MMSGGQEAAQTVEKHVSGWVEMLIPIASAYVLTLGGGLVAAWKVMTRRVAVVETDVRLLQQHIAADRNVMTAKLEALADKIADIHEDVREIRSRVDR